jgi:hypothetical protein
VRQRRPLDDPALTSPGEVLDAVEHLEACGSISRSAPGSPGRDERRGAWGPLARPPMSVSHACRTVRRAERGGSGSAARSSPAP